MKKLLLIPFLFASLAARADTYTHEFVLEDGSAVECSITYITSRSSSSSCEYVPYEARKAGQEAFIAGMRKLNACADLSAKARSIGYSEDYAIAALSSCLGRDLYDYRRPSEPGMAYKISCEGELTNIPVDLGYKRSLAECPGLVEIVLSGELPYRSQFAF